MLTFFKVERNAAYLLLAFASLGLVLANSPLAESFNVLRETKLGPSELGLDLTISHWLGEGFMTAFFLLIGLELRREFAFGVFQKASALVIPGLAALFGAILPAAVFICLVSGPASVGWPIPMATDVTFALAVFAIFGRLMPASSRVFLLAFAVIDDLIAILVIALFLSKSLDVSNLAIALVFLAAFAGVQRWNWATKSSAPVPAIDSTPALASAKRIRAVLATAAALLAWYFMLESGVSPAVMGVLLGLSVAPKYLEALETRIHPWVSLLILPIFALFATGVSLSGANGQNVNGAGLAFTAVTLAILLRPLAKILGISLGAMLGRRLLGSDAFSGMKTSDYWRISVLGGIGFTVSLLITAQVYANDSGLTTEAVVATLIAMVVSMLAGAWALSIRKPQLGH
jgi:NhaA family Na+:H+ antiporter